MIYWMIYGMIYWTYFPILQHKLWYQQEMEQSDTTWIKICLMVAFFLEVTIFGRFISRLHCFVEGKIMGLAMTFSGSLFLSIAMIDIIPEAISNFNVYFRTQTTFFQSSSSLKQNGYLPLTLIIAMITLMIIMYLDKILIGHSHDHEYEVSFVHEPKKSLNQSRRIDVPQQKNPDQPEGEEPNETNEPKTEIERNKSHGDAGLNWKPFILQLGMSIHSFFECLAVGLQKSPMSVLGLASAILVHKWAEGLTLGLMYQKDGFSRRLISVMILIQGIVNVLGLVTGCFLINQGIFVMAFFMSISAGTFLYISLVEVLSEQLKSFTRGKMLMMVLANCFIALIVWFQKLEESELDV